MIQRLGLTMRVMKTQYPRGDFEIRDALAHDWSAFLHKVLPEIPWMPVPNAEGEALRLVNAFGINGLVLTGGDDWGQTPLRDATETLLLEWAKQKHIPVLGVCRGAQVVNRFLGGDLSSVPQGHTATRHNIHWNSSTVEVNSYHQQGFFPENLANGLHCLATADDGTVEAFVCSELPWRGIMWHPEREIPCSDLDRTFLRNLFMENV